MATTWSSANNLKSTPEPARWAGKVGQTITRVALSGLVSGTGWFFSSTLTTCFDFSPLRSSGLISAAFSGKLVTLHSVPKHGAGLADDLFRGRLRYLNENWDFDAGTSVAKVQPVAVNVGTADDASCYGSNRNFDKGKRAGSPAPHMGGNFGHYFLDIIVPNLNVVSGVALECEFARGIVECELA